MASSPPTSTLGAIGDVGRAAPQRAPSRAAENAENSSFSDALEDARGDRSEAREAPAKPVREREPARTEATATAEPIAPAAKADAPAAATPPAPGNALPPGGEDLPVAATVEQLLAGMAGATPRTEAGKGGKEKPVADTSDVEAAVGLTTGAVIAAVAPLPPVLPENSVATAAAFTARPGQPASADDGTTEPLTDATQKRAIPTAAQTVNDVVPSLSGELAEVLNTTKPTPASDAVAVAPTHAKAADDGAVADELASVVPAVAAPPGVMASVAPAATSATDTAASTTPALPGLSSGQQGDRGVEPKLAAHGPRNDNAMATPMPPGMPTAEGMPLNAVAGNVAGNVAGKSAELVEGGDSAAFGDTLKQIETTLAGRGSESPAPVSGTPRDNGLRQYLDTSATAVKVEVPVGKQGWSEGVAAKVMWMSAQNLSSAEIQMNPPDLGPLSVRVSSQQDQTSVYFSSPHAQVRDALDQSLPRLREMFGNQGMGLLDVGVGGQGSTREQRAFDHGNGQGGNAAPGNRGRDGDVAVDTVNPARATVIRTRPGLLDAYA